MAVANGRPYDIVGPPIQLGDFLAERREVVLNGQTYLAWVVTNRRYPREIMLKLDRAARAYSDVIKPLLEPLPEGQTELDQARLDALERQPEAWAIYVQEAARLLVQGVTDSDLDIVPTETLHQLGQELGYFPPDEAATGETEASPEGEEATAPLTGNSSPESSGASTDTEPIPTAS